LAYSTARAAPTSRSSSQRRDERTSQIPTRPPQRRQGATNDSKREAQVAQDLDLVRHAQDPHERVDSVERQFPMPLMVNDVKVADYLCDFLVVYADARKELLEVKSPATIRPLFRLKLKFG
jgi:hypothetical protein